MPRRNKRKHKGAEPGTLGAGGGKGGPGENWGGEHMRQAPRPLIAVTPDRTLIAVAFGTEVRVYDTETGALATLASVCAFDAAAAAAREDGADAPDASRWHTDAIRALSFDSTGASMCTAGDDKLARVWRVEKSPDEPTAGTARGAPESKKPSASLVCVRCARLPKKACAAAFAAGGAVAAFADKFGDVHALPVTARTEKARSENARTEDATNARGPTDAQASLESDEATYLFGHCCSIITDACACDETRLLATADRDFKIRVARLPEDTTAIFDRAIGVPEIQSFCHGHAAFVACVAPVPGRAQIVSGGGDGAARLWRCEDGAPLGAATLAPPRTKKASGDDDPDQPGPERDDTRDESSKRAMIVTGEAPRESVDAPAVTAMVAARSGAAYAAVENRPGELAELRVASEATDGTVDALTLVGWHPIFPDDCQAAPTGLHYDETRGELIGVYEKTRADGGAEAAVFFAFGKTEARERARISRALAVPGMAEAKDRGVSLGDAMRKRGYDAQMREERKKQRKDFKSGGASLSNA